MMNIGEDEKMMNFLKVCNGLFIYKRKYSLNENKYE